MLLIFFEHLNYMNDKIAIRTRQKKVINMGFKNFSAFQPFTYSIYIDR